MAELAEEVTSPTSLSFSRTKMSSSYCASVRAAAEPMAPAPMMMRSFMGSSGLVDEWGMKRGEAGHAVRNGFPAFRNMNVFYFSTRYFLCATAATVRKMIDKTHPAQRKMNPPSQPKLWEMQPIR